MTGPLAIFAALPEETACLERSMAVESRFPLDRCRVIVGRLAGMSIIVSCTGDGAGNAAAGARAVLGRFPVTHMIITGVAGALSPGLSHGMVMVASEVRGPGAPVPPPDKAWADRTLNGTPATMATFLSSDDMLCSVDAKRRAYGRFSPGTVATVDLESSTLARAAGERGLAYLAIRSISDTAEESLPLDLNSLRDDSGAVDRRRVTMKALRTPSLMLPLWRLKRRVALCSRRIAEATRVAVERAA